MKRGNLIHNIFCAVILSWICILGLTGCGGDSGPTPRSLAIITTSLPEGQVNQPYSASVGGSGGALPLLVVGHAGASCRSFVQYAKRRDHRDTRHSGNQFAYIYPGGFLNPSTNGSDNLSA